MLYFLQGGPSHVFTMADGLERDLVHRIRAIAGQSDYHTVFCFSSNLRDLIRDILDPYNVQVPFRIINTIMLVTYKICKKFEPELRLLNDCHMLHLIRQKFTFFVNCFAGISDIISCQDIPESINRMHREMLLTVGQYLNRLIRLICRKLRELAYRNQAPNFNLNQQNVLPPKYLKDEESLISCPSLKEKLASSSKTLVEAAADDFCSVCLGGNILTQENFAILNKCAHLFCQPCIKQWFKNA